MNKTSNDRQENPVQTGSSQEDLFIVGIGASAGGLDALREILSNMTKDINNFAVIIAQHISPNFKSLLVELLGKGTHLETVEIENGAELCAGKLYVTPRDSNVTVRENKFIIDRVSVLRGPKPNIDLLFESLAENFGKMAVGVIVSGTGRDGAEGIQAIKNAGGLTVAQEPQTAKSDGMPSASIQTGDIDLVLSPDRIGIEISDFLQNPDTLRKILIKQPEEREGMKEILNLLSKRIGTDFSQYKISTITRRLDKRIFAAKKNSIKSYLKFIQEKPQELDELFNTILIGVTRFFRDSEAFKDLAGNLERIISNKYVNEPIRIWTPGCATGEEAYSIAILVSKILKDHPGQYDIQIFATDIDEKAIEHARRGVYPKESFVDMDNDLLDEFFIAHGNKYEIIKSVKQLVLFSKHDLTINPPFLRLDLISCRNLLIYFDTELQKKIIPLFHYALNPNGFLFLGKSETVGQFSDLFVTVEAKSKIFKRKTGTGINHNRFHAFMQGKTQVREKAEDSKPAKKLSTPERVKETLYKTFEHPYVVINDSLDIIEISGDINTYLSFKEGMMNANILRLICSELELELRGLLPKAVRNFTEVKSGFISVIRKSERHSVRITIKPLLYSDKEKQQFLLIFERYKIDEKLLNSGIVNDSGEEDPRIAQLTSELAMAKENLKMYIEELEAANEELQSLNEELQSTNEELQATNEELETSNEELQSTNEEIQIAYNELREIHEELECKEIELQESKANLLALINNNLQAFILIDKEFLINEYNTEAGTLLKNLTGKSVKNGGLISDYFHEDDKVKMKELLNLCKDGKIIEGEAQLKNRKGEETWFAYNFVPVEDKGKLMNISCGLLNISEIKKIKSELSEKDKLIKIVFSSADVGMSIVDEDGKLIMANKGYFDLYGYEENELIGESFASILPPENQKEAENILAEFFAGKRDHFPTQWKARRKDDSLIDVHKTSVIIEQNNGKKLKVSTVRDISDMQRYQAILEETERAAFVGGWQYFPNSDTFSKTAEINRILDLNKNDKVSFEKFYDFCTTENRTELQKALKITLEDGDPFSLELKINTAKGNEKWVIITAKAERMYNRTISVYGTIRDISDAKYRELRLHENVKFLDTLLHTIPGPVFFKDFEGKYRIVNDRFCDQIIGLHKEQIIGKSISELQERIPKEMAKIYIEKDKELLKTGKEQNYTAAVLCADKVARHFRFSKSLFKHADGSTIGIVGVMTEVEDTKNSIK